MGGEGREKCAMARWGFGWQLLSWLVLELQNLMSKRGRWRLGSRRCRKREKEEVPVCYKSREKANVRGGSVKFPS